MKKRQPWKRRRLFFVVVSLLFGLLTIGLLVCFFQADRLIRTGAQSIGSEACGTEVRIEKVQFHLFDGELELHDLIISNPPDYESAEAVRIDLIRLHCDPKTLFSDRLHIRELRVQNIVVNHEQRNDTSNIDEIMTAVRAFTSKPREPEVEDRYVDIDHFAFVGAELRLLKPETDQQKTLILAPIELYNVGENGTLLETIQVLATAVSSEIAITVTRSSDWYKRSQKALDETVDEIGRGTREAFRNLRQLFQAPSDRPPRKLDGEEPDADQKPEDIE